MMRLGFKSVSMTRRFCSKAVPANVMVVKTLEEYEGLKVGKSDLMVGWFFAKWSTPAKMFEQDFDKMAAQYPNCDVDEVPKAAYDAEVVDSPQVSMIPTGARPDGSLYGKADMKTVKANLANYSEVVPEAKKVVDSFKFGPSPKEKKAWVFDPATGTTLPQHESY